MAFFFTCLFFVAPLFPLPIALRGHERTWKSVRWPVYFSIAYVLLQVLANYFVYYCFSRGYEDALHSLIVPWAVAILAWPASWLFFSFSFAGKKRRENPPPAL